jgi:4-amino-4-deoxy-L-arabinose transferase-like glycosyltransferase
MFDRLAHWMKAEDARAEGDPRAPWRLFWVAFLIRVAYMTLAHTYHVRSYGDHFQFGWEAGRIGRSLATGHGYGNPFTSFWLPYTGPTAWLPPVYPLIIAAVFKLFGVYTNASAWVLLTINSILSAATAMAVWEIGYRCFSYKNAVWSGWIWALYPSAMQYAVRWIWEMTVTTALFTFVIVLALRMRQIHVGTANESSHNDISRDLRRWLIFGLLWGLIALSNSTLLLFLPICGLWILFGTWQRPHSLRNAILGAFVFLICLAPWEIHNYKVFHRLIPIRGNLGAEAYLGNGPGSNGLLMSYDHPNMAYDQFLLYKSMGEVHYVAMRGELAKEWIHAHPAHFVSNILKRIYMFWVSVPSDSPWKLELPRVLSYSFISLAGLLGLALALSNHVPAAGLFAWAFLLLPVSYYLVTVHARFRHPLEPLITVLGVYLFQAAIAKDPVLGHSSHHAIASQPS